MIINGQVAKIESGGAGVTPDIAQGLVEMTTSSYTTITTTRRFSFILTPSAINAEINVKMADYPDGNYSATITAVSKTSPASVINATPINCTITKSNGVATTDITGNMTFYALGTSSQSSLTRYIYLAIIALSKN